MALTVHIKGRHYPGFPDCELSFRHGDVSCKTEVVDDMAFIRLQNVPVDEMTRRLVHEFGELRGNDVYEVDLDKIDGVKFTVRALRELFGFHLDNMLEVMLAASAAAASTARNSAPAEILDGSSSSSSTRDETGTRDDEKSAVDTREVGTTTTTTTTQTTHDERPEFALKFLTED